MTTEMALCYIDNPSVMSVNEIQPLLTAAQEFLPIVLKNIQKYRKHIIKLSLEGIRIILSRDDLKVDIEDEAYDLLVDWAKEQSRDDSKEIQRFLTAEMFDLIRFQHMTPPKLKTVLEELLDSNHLDPSAITSMIDAIVHEENKSFFQMHCRAYNLHPITVMTFKNPMNQCVVYLNLRREECENNTCIKSQSFTLDENTFYLEVRHHKDEKFSGCYLHLKTRKKQSDVVIEYGFAVRQRSSPREFLRVRNSVTYTFKYGKNVGCCYRDIFGEKWHTIMDKNSNFLINETLHLRADINLLYEN